MTTYAELIETLRAEREAVSEQIIALQGRQKALSVQIRNLETAIGRPKAGQARPDDPVPEGGGQTIVMTVEPAEVGAAAGKG